MSHDFTQQQSPADEERSQQLSVQHTRPPTEVPGYRMERFLGAGAYGEVWVGVDRNTGRQVAIKFYAHKRGVDWQLLAREVEKLVFLSADRYVVQLLEVGWDAEPPYYVMEFLENGSLEDLLRTNGTMPVNEAVEMFTDICQGLSHAHGKGVLHCDLKPANILLDQDQKPRLADFGQSRLSSEQTPALGTLFYMAPEQADLAAVPDARWDVYALGAILHCLLAGSPPFREEETIAKIDSAVDLPDRLARYRTAIQSAPAPLAHRRIAGMDRALVDILERCLAVDPEERFANVQEVLSALSARQRQRQMRPVLAFGFAFPILLLIVMAFFGWRGYHQALRDTEVLAKRRAVENNRFAAQLAAERVAAEIERYFEIASQEAHRESLNEHFDAVRQHPLLSQLVSVPMESLKLARLQEEFSADSKRSDMESYLERRLRRYRRHPKLASMFVLNAEGTMLAAAYAEEAAPAVAKNFAYRSYFHGGMADLPADTRPPSVKPVRETHLSAVFQSSTTKKWKVAVATPIWRDVPDSEMEQVAGLLVVTLNLGDFEFFKAIQSEEKDRLAVLIDGRPGDHTGVILQHPLFDQVLEHDPALPTSFQNCRVDLQTGGTLAGDEYDDPLGKIPQGQAFARSWLAAAAPVRSVNGDDTPGAPKTSGLVVLVQEDYLAVISPVRKLGERLAREGLFALAVVILVTIMLWFAVLRIVRSQRTTSRVIINSPRTSTPVPLDTTLASPPKQK